MGQSLTVANMGVQSGDQHERLMQQLVDALLVGSDARHAVARKTKVWMSYALALPIGAAVLAMRAPTCHKHHPLA